MLDHGKQAVVWISDEGARLFLGLERSKEVGRRWAFFGKIADDCKSLGLWVNIERIEEREFGTEAKLIQTWSVTPQNCLVRSDFIIAVQVFAKNNPREKIGFKAKRP